VVCELEAAGERAVGNAAMEEFTSGLARSFRGDAEKVLLNNDFDFVGGKTGDRESDAVGVRAGLRDVVGRIVVDRFVGAVDERVKQPIEANGGAEEGMNSLCMGLSYKSDDEAATNVRRTRSGNPVHLIWSVILRVKEKVARSSGYLKINNDKELEKCLRSTK